MGDAKAGRKTAIVIGAGVGGISTATRLQHAGFQVTVLEKNAYTGGRCSLLYSDPANPSSSYRFDQGPSLLLLPHLFHRTFHDLDTSIEAEGVELRKCEPNYHVWFGDGEQFKLSTDLAVMKGEIERWEGKDGFERYLGFLAEAHRHYEISVRHVLLRNFTSLLSMLRLGFLRWLLALHPFESIWTRASRYFWTERLRRVFTFGSMYMGMSPFDAPGTYSLLQYTELAEGIWYPVGGFYAVIRALENVGRREGAEYRLNTAVSKILLSEDGSAVRGVELEGGEVLLADVVVNNSDLVYAYRTLLPESGYAKSLQDRPSSCSSISFYWGLSQRVPELEAHNIFLADDYRESFDAIFKKHLIPTEPSFYVNVPSRIDASAAPPGKDSVVVLVPVGHLIDHPSSSAPSSSSSSTNGPISPSPSNPGLTPSPHQDWPAMIALARRTILATIAARTALDLTPLITHEQTNSPQTWQETFNLDRGAILGLSHSFFNVLCFRPTTRARRPCRFDEVMKGWGVVGRVAETGVDVWRRWWGRRDVGGLYMVGASAHPGTGVPIVLAGGALVAEQVCGDLRVGVPWKGRVEGKGMRRDKALDRMERPVLWEEWIGVVGMGLLPLIVVLLWIWGWATTSLQVSHID